MLVSFTFSSLTLNEVVKGLFFFLFFSFLFFLSFLPLLTSFLSLFLHTRPRGLFRFRQGQSCNAKVCLFLTFFSFFFRETDLRSISSGVFAQKGMAGREMMTLTKCLFWLRERPAVFSLFCPSFFWVGGVWGENSDLMSFVEVSAIIRERARCVQFFRRGRVAAIFVGGLLQLFFWPLSRFTQNAQILFDDLYCGNPDLAPSFFTARERYFFISGSRFRRVRNFQIWIIAGLLLFWEICGTALAHSLARNNTLR